MQVVEIDVPAQNAPHLWKNGWAIQQVHQRLVFLDNVGRRQQFATLLRRAIAGIDTIDDVNQPLNRGLIEGILDRELPIAVEELALVGVRRCCTQLGCMGM